MTWTRLAAGAAAILALAVPAAGCGDDDADQFRDGYNAAVDRLSTINTDIGQAAGGAAGQSNKAIAKEFNAIAEAAEKTRSDLADLDPPEDAQDEFDALLSAMDQGVKDLRAVASAAKDNDPQAGQEAARALSKSGQEITAAENELKKVVDG